MERNTNAVISTNKLCKSYMNGEVPQHVIKNMDIQIFYKDFTVFMGPSGSGKSTLLHILSGMDRASMGEVYFKDTNFSKYSEKQLAQFRKGLWERRKKRRGDFPYTEIFQGAECKRKGRLRNGYVHRRVSYKRHGRKTVLPI